MCGKLIQTRGVAIVLLLSSLSLEAAMAAEPPLVAPATPIRIVTEECHTPPVRPLAEISILPPGDEEGPADSSGRVFAARIEPPRLRDDTLVHGWAPTNLSHQPLYFDDTTVERYGQTHGPLVQPITSAARFYATFPVMPVKLLQRPPHSPVTTLGRFRPGSPTPALKQKLLAR